MAACLFNHTTVRPSPPFDPQELYHARLKFYSHQFQQPIRQARPYQFDFLPQEFGLTGKSNKLEILHANAKFNGHRRRREVRALTGVSQQDYLNYLWQMKNGSDAERGRRSFALIDINRRNFITRKQFEIFLQDFLQAWGAVCGSEDITHLERNSEQIVNLFYSKTESIDFPLFLSKVYPSPHFRKLYELITISIRGIYLPKNNKKDFSLYLGQVDSILAKAKAQFQLLDPQSLARSQAQQLPTVKPLPPLVWLQPKVKGVVKFSGQTGSQQTLSLRSVQQSQVQIREQKLKKAHDVLHDICKDLQKLKADISGSPKGKQSGLQQELLRSTTVRNVHCSKSKQKQGMMVQLGHKSWKLVINMMIGIKTAVNSAESREEIYKQIKFNQISTYQLTEGQEGQAFKFIDYAPLCFKQIRNQFSIRCKDYVHSVGPDHVFASMLMGQFSSLQELTSQGKSGSFFYYSGDGRFMLKTITQRQFELFIKILQAYRNHVSSHPHTLVSRILGLHQLQHDGLQIYFIVMANVFSGGMQIIQRYDLKGSLYDRFTPQINSKVTKKDQNFLKNRPEGLALNPQVRSKLLQQIKTDVQFFKKLNLIDYSMLVGVSDLEGRLSVEGRLSISSALFEQRARSLAYQVNINGLEEYQVGIIDFLTQYSARKAAQHFVKRVFLGPDISAVPAQQYGSRFVQFMKRVFR